MTTLILLACSASDYKVTPNVSDSDSNSSGTSDTGSGGGNSSTDGVGLNYGGCNFAAYLPIDFSSVEDTGELLNVTSEWQPMCPVVTDHDYGDVGFPYFECTDEMDQSTSNILNFAIELLKGTLSLWDLVTCDVSATLYFEIVAKEASEDGDTGEASGDTGETDITAPGLKTTARFWLTAENADGAPTSDDFITNGVAGNFSANNIYLEASITRSEDEEDVYELSLSMNVAEAGMEPLDENRLEVTYRINPEGGGVDILQVNDLSYESSVTYLNLEPSQAQILDEVLEFIDDIYAVCAVDSDFSGTTRCAHTF